MSNNSHDDYFRADGDEHTRVIPVPGATGATAATPMDPEAARLEHDRQLRAQEKAERDRQLGKVERGRGPEPVAPVVHKATTDKFMGSVGLWLLRWVVAAIMGVHGYQKLTDLAGTQQFIASLGLPSPYWLALGAGIAEVLAAVALFFGLLTRVAGLGVAVVAIAALALVKWGHANPFQPNTPGFVGELELLLAAAGLALFFLGSGRWGIDGQVRSNRRKAKLAR